MSPRSDLTAWFWTGTALRTLSPAGLPGIECGYGSPSRLAPPRKRSWLPPSASERLCSTAARWRAPDSPSGSSLEASPRAGQQQIVIIHQRHGTLELGQLFGQGDGILPALLRIGQKCAAPRLHA